ncbi:methylmalonic aciduria and homocystinuria type D homolog, mitochondrial [Drosophila biarmipes]|uniref:methylmalonic aciduria and homocystinuria type D homolog, mitochondrial n=1 Tax=Drosophila biarmipes TaxID=125945 RepID=UPI0007E82E82|nr:methylmalonic aciduria and homocystinuria type D homolog, mitochondrial [Drosophila biarmipes]XP_016948759.1 methylmalonic aciduria and homocystinuria type D homolog, mitochondrial [Drosophila biarmipes]
MSRSLSRVLGTFSPATGTGAPNRLTPLRGLLGTVVPVAGYSKRNGPPSDAGEPFKTVSKSRDLDGDDDLHSLESEPNWELTADRSNRFYLPNATGPAWQGDTTTVGLLTPLGQLVNFLKEANADKSRLEFACCQCPILIRESLVELFPVRVVAQRDSAITMLVLSYEGDIEMGAAKFVLAARDISDRLLSLGYWADFLNPFSGRPYFMPRDGAKLYKQDHRFRGLNMRLSLQNHCTVIAAEENDTTHFSGTIYCTAPNHYDQLVELLVPPPRKVAQ